MTTDRIEIDALRGLVRRLTADVAEARRVAAEQLAALEAESARLRMQNQQLLRQIEELRHGRRGTQ